MTQEHTQLLEMNAAAYMQAAIAITAITTMLSLETPERQKILREALQRNLSIFRNGLPKMDTLDSELVTTIIQSTCDSLLESLPE